MIEFVFYKYRLHKELAVQWFAPTLSRMRRSSDNYPIILFLATATVTMLSRISNFINHHFILPVAFNIAIFS